jgi:hypothetical protein
LHQWILLAWLRGSNCTSWDSTWSWISKLQVQGVTRGYWGVPANWDRSRHTGKTRGNAQVITWEISVHWRWRRKVGQHCWKRSGPIVPSRRGWGWMRLIVLRHRSDRDRQQTQTTYCTWHGALAIATTLAWHGV